MLDAVAYFAAKQGLPHERQNPRAHKSAAHLEGLCYAESPHLVAGQLNAAYVGPCKGGRMRGKTPVLAEGPNGMHVLSQRMHATGDRGSRLVSSSEVAPLLRTKTQPASALVLTLPPPQPLQYPSRSMSLTMCNQPHDAVLRAPGTETRSSNTKRLPRKKLSEPGNASK